MKPSDERYIFFEHLKNKKSWTNFSTNIDAMIPAERRTTSSVLLLFCVVYADIAHLPDNISYHFLATQFCVFLFSYENFYRQYIWKYPFKHLWEYRKHVHIGISWIENQMNDWCLFLTKLTLCAYLNHPDEMKDTRRHMDIGARGNFVFLGTSGKNANPWIQVNYTDVLMWQ